MENEELTKNERRELRKDEQRKQDKASDRARSMRSIVKAVPVVIIILVVVVFGIIYTSGKKVLPPTDMTNHIEQSPSSHIVDVPLDTRVFKHMLEHSDGSGSPGVIISYDCEEYECENDLISNLSKFVEANPSFVYLAPYRNLAAKIVLTRLGKQESLDNFDEEAIRKFILN